MRQLWLTALAWSELAHMDLVGFRGFPAQREAVKRVRVDSGRKPSIHLADIMTAVNNATALYVRRPQCLKRSAAVTRLLRRHGFPAELVIGCRHSPVIAHAWVEVDGRVVSDYVFGLEHYAILDRW